MPPIKLSERERNLLIVTLGFVIFYIFYQFLLTPKWAEIEKLKDQARGRRLELKVAEGKMKILEAIEKSVGIFPEKSKAPQAERALEVLRDLSQATAKSGLNLSYIKPLPDDRGEDLKFSLSCTGKYKNLYDFLVILHELPTLILVDSLNVESPGGAAPTLSIEITLTALTRETRGS